MTEQQQKLYDKLLKKVNEYCLGAAAEDVIATIDALVDTYETQITTSEYLLEGVKCYYEGGQFTLKNWVQNNKALEIIKKHKLLNYVLKNPKCASMYHLNDEEIIFLKEITK